VTNNIEISDGQYHEECSHITILFIITHSHITLLPKDRCCGI